MALSPQSRLSGGLPARLLDSRNQPLVGHPSKANAAYAELAIDGPGSAAEAAAHPDLDPVARPEFFLGRAFLVRLEPNKIPLKLNTFRCRGHIGLFLNC
jgi:hypothetical protein